MKTSFNGLKVSEDGVYTAYDLTPEELESLKRHFGNRMKGSDGNYTICETSYRRVILKLFVHEARRLIEFDIRRDLLDLFNCNQISADTVKKLEEKLMEKRVRIDVDYSWSNNTWSISNHNAFIELLKSCIAEL